MGRDELDLVAREGDVLVFVEVKTRRSEKFGRPFTAVDRRKRACMSRAAVRYLQRLKVKPPYIRFDVVEVVGIPPAKPLVRHLPAAFHLSRRYSLAW